MVYSFGCSFTYGQCDDRILENHFTKLLADKHNTGFINTGIPGASNQDIWNQFTSHLLDFKKDDIVIIGITTPERVQIPCRGGVGLDLWSKAFFSEQECDHNHPLWRKNKWVRGFPIGSPELLVDLVVDYFDNMEHKFAGFKSPKQFFELFIPNYTLYMDSIKEHIEEYFYKLYYNQALKLAKRGVKVVIWDYNVWGDVINMDYDNNLCGCGHWNGNGHKAFSKLLNIFLKQLPGKILFDPKECISIYNTPIL